MLGAKYAQVLACSPLSDNRLQQHGLRLLSKICKAHRIIPSSYTLQQELIHVGRVYYYGGFADVSNGKYSGLTVAIKRLKMNEGDSDRIFKVSTFDQPRASLLLSYRPAVMSGGDQLETSISSKHPSFVGGFCVRGPALFPHPHRVDAQRECNAVCEI